MTLDLVGMAPFWFVLGLAARAALDDWLDSYEVRHNHQKRRRGER